jgi:hypothetical protein
MGIWEKVKEQIIENQGDISEIQGIPQYLKDIYKTSFTTSPYAYIEVAARAQKWVDQALSRNMYLETRDIDETMAIYMTAWMKGLKSTYYLHMKPRHTAEQSTTKVNKAEKMGKVGFASVASARKEDKMIAPQSVPTPLSDAEIATITVDRSPSFAAKREERVQDDAVAAAMAEKISDSVSMAASNIAAPARGFGAVNAPGFVPMQPSLLKSTTKIEARPEVKTEARHSVQSAPVLKSTVQALTSTSSADSMKEMMAKLANNPNFTVKSAKTDQVSTDRASSPAKFPKLSPAQVQDMMDNFGKKPAASMEGMEDPGTANICIGCE